MVFGRSTVAGGASFDGGIDRSIQLFILADQITEHPDDRGTQTVALETLELSLADGDRVGRLLAASERFREIMALVREYRGHLRNGDFAVLVDAIGINATRLGVDAC